MVRKVLFIALATATFTSSAFAKVACNGRNGTTLEIDQQRGTISWNVHGINEGPFVFTGYNKTIVNNQGRVIGQVERVFSRPYAGREILERFVLITPPLTYGSNNVTRTEFNNVSCRWN